MLKGTVVLAIAFRGGASAYQGLGAPHGAGPDGL
jgi:hypothetical protein